MARPAGVQIRRWFGALVGLLIAVDLAALGGSLVIAGSVDAVVGHAQPLARATATIRTEILAAQKELFRYLAEFTADTSAAVAHLTPLSDGIDAARQASRSPEVSAELEAIETSVERYRKVLELMPGTVAGSRDWSRIKEYSAAAVQLGSEVEDRAGQLAAAADAEIRARSESSSRIARVALWASAGVLVLSLVLVLLLRHWWVRFQDQILGF